jgi:hypothetical protein
LKELKRGKYGAEVDQQQMMKESMDACETFSMYISRVMADIGRISRSRAVRRRKKRLQSFIVMKLSAVFCYREKKFPPHTVIKLIFSGDKTSMS